MTRALIEEASAIVSLALVLAMIFVWAGYFGGML